MPRYTYRCEKCEEVFEVVHSISEKLEVCECDNAGSLVRIPSFAFISSVQKKEAVPPKTGELVKKHIEESRAELQKEKKRLTSEEYK